MKQLQLIPKKHYAHRKVAREISTREFMHVILKSRLPVLRRRAPIVRSIIRRQQQLAGITIKMLAVQPDHIHLCLKTPTRRALANFLRAVAGIVARKCRLEWRQRIWSRIVHAGRDLVGVVLYIACNPIKSGHWDERVDALWIVDGRLSE